MSAVLVTGATGWTGRDVVARQLAAGAEVRALTRAPASAARMLLGAWNAALGQPAYVTHTVEELTGIPARTFREWVSEHAAASGSPPAGSDAAPVA